MGICFSNKASLVPTHPVEVQPQVLHYDKPPTLPDPMIICVSQPSSVVIGRDGGWCGGGEGAVVAACGSGGGAGEEQPVSAFDMFSLSFHNSAVRLAGSLARSNIP